MNKTCDITNVVLSGNIIDYVHKTKYLGVLLCSDMKTSIDVCRQTSKFYAQANTLLLITFVTVQMMLNVCCFIHFAPICIVPHYGLTLLYLA